MTVDNERKKQIIAEATKIFAKYGYRRSTTEDVAAACGLTKTALYYYFPTKAAIFAEVIRGECEIFLKVIREAIARCNCPKTKFRALITTRFDHLQRLLYLHQSSLEIAKEIMVASENYRDSFDTMEAQLLAEILKEGIRKKVFRKHDAERVSRGILVACRGFEKNIINDEKGKVSFGLDEMIDIFLRGISLIE